MTEFEKLLHQIPDVYVMDPSVPASDYAVIDLSVGAISHDQVSTPQNFENFLETYATSLDSVFLFGGYNEKRDLYQRSTIFKGDLGEERNIHIGIDIWAEAGTPIYAALNGKVHSFKCNEGLGNYGPTIILEHSVAKHTFYTLYGHLSFESIQNLKVGDEFTKGMRLGALGDSLVNGDYAPHLHFQVIRDTEGNFGDYPGVCSEQTLTHFLDNCPDPNLLLKLKKP